MISTANLLLWLQKEANEAHGELAGSDAGAGRWAIANTLIQSGKLGGVEPRPISPMFCSGSSTAAPIIPAALMIDRCPGAMSDGLNALQIADEEVPSILAGGDNGLVAVPDEPAELIAAEIVPDIFHWVEFR